MQRFGFPAIVMPRRACLAAAACLALGGGPALAQSATTTPVIVDPLAPQLQTNTRNPPRFQRSDRAPLAQAPATDVFTPPASGAGRTGFDSSNSRATRARRATRAIAPGAAQTLPESPYQKPIPPLATPTPRRTPAPASASTSASAPAPASGGTGAYAQATPWQPPQIGPIRPPIPKRKVVPEDPYAPLGIRAGPFLWFPALELSAAYNTNPGQTPTGSGSTVYTIAPELRGQSDWSRHELKVDLRGSYTDYNPDQTPGLSRPFFSGRVDGRVDVTRDTHIELNTRTLITTDNPNNPNLPADLAKLPLYIVFGGGVGLRQTFNRFELLVKGDVQRTAYQNSELTNGQTVSNEDQNYNQYGGTLRGSYELTPGVKPFLELEADTRIHDLYTDSSGFHRDSNGGYGTVGTTFEITRLLTGDIAGGYMQRDYVDPRLGTIGGPIGSGSLLWTADALNTVKLTATATIGESTIPDVPGVLSRDIGMQYDHAFRRWLIGTVKAGFGTDLYPNAITGASGQTSDRLDKRYYVAVGATYKLNPMVQVKGEVREDWLHSNVESADYNATTFTLGMRLQR
ncbi:MAG TPA: outer membrane beta-barrel protein [Pseudolabrys sp.]|nr:outer membrane beta-barrel protein [Pseudolabrys sp.]